MGYAEAFKALRHAYRLTQAEFAELLRVSKPTIQKLEAGNYPPSEKMSARLAELFRSERFVSEFRPRVESGDLRAVGAVFGGLLELADADSATAPKTSPAPVTQGGLADAYADMKRDHDEFLAMMRSQQNTIQSLSVSNQNFSVSTKTIAESTKNFSESTKTIAESNRNLSESTKTIAESNRNLSESNKSFAESTKNFVASTNNFSESTRNFSVSTKSLAESNKNLSESNRNLTMYLSKNAVSVSKSKSLKH